MRKVVDFGKRIIGLYKKWGHRFIDRLWRKHCSVKSTHENDDDFIVIFYLLWRDDWVATEIGLLDVTKPRSSIYETRDGTTAHDDDNSNCWLCNMNLI
jgi:hypothetical protein